MTPEELRDLACRVLAEMKARDVSVLDVRRSSTITDYMLVASATSDRHVRSLVTGVLEAAREQGIRPVGVEGEAHAQWALLDLGDVIVHIMRPEVRDFYQLEKLWGFDGSGESAD